MGLAKCKCTSKQCRKKELSKASVHKQKRGTFLGKEVLWKMCEKEMQKGNAVKGCQLM
jgi:hypothetical protein